MFEKVAELLEKKDVKEKITIALQKTKETRKEHAFNFLFSNGEIMSGEVIEGNEHSIKPPISQEHIIGTFHTHPNLISRDIYPSIDDIGKLIVTKEFICIGGNKKKLGIVRCFDSKDILNEFMKALEVNWHNKKTGEIIDFEIIKELVNKELRTNDSMKFPSGVDIHQENEKMRIILAHLIDRMMKDDNYFNMHSYKKKYVLR